MKTAENFKLGVYRHYRTKGLYTALQLVLHHDTRHLMVIYISHEHGTVNARPLLGWMQDPDGWLDQVRVNGKLVDRFEWVGPAAGMDGVFKFVPDPS